MEARYICSYCNESINVGDDIVLIAKNEEGKTGLILLKTKLGDYTTRFSSGFSVSEGDVLKLSCPFCDHNLTNKENERLAHFIQVNNDNVKYHIVISAIYGEKCTYKVQEHKVIEKFGEHWTRYQNPDWFLLT